MSHDVYESPLNSRYASKEMSALWSDQHKHSTWRRIWVALAESQLKAVEAIDQKLEGVEGRIWFEGLSEDGDEHAGEPGATEEPATANP